MMGFFPNYKNMNLVYRSPQGNQLWLGDWSAATDLKLLASKSIKYVYTAAALDVSYKKDSGIIQKKIDAFDMPNYDMSQHFGSAFSFLSEALQNGNVLVHCAAGVSRSATIVIMYLMRLHSWPMLRALNFVREKRSVICPNPGFLRQLDRFQKTLQPNIKLKEQQAAVFKFLKDDDQLKRNGSLMAKSGMKSTQQSAFSRAGKSMRANSTQKGTDKANEWFTNTLKQSAKEPLVRDLLKDSLKRSAIKQPRIVNHKK